MASLYCICRELSSLENTTNDNTEIFVILLCFNDFFLEIIQRSRHSGYEYKKSQSRRLIFDDTWWMTMSSKSFVTWYKIIQFSFTFHLKDGARFVPIVAQLHLMRKKVIYTTDNKRSSIYEKRFYNFILFSYIMLLFYDYFNTFVRLILRKVYSLLLINILCMECSSMD